jgi:hypothetical protein
MPIYLHKMSGPGSAGDVWISTLHTSSAGTLTAVHSAWQTFCSSIVSTSLGAVWPTATSVTNLATVQLDPTTGKQVAATSSGVALAGTSVTAVLSPRDSIVLSLRTIVPTKAGRGRMFLPGPAGNFMSATGLLLGGTATSIANAIGTAMTTLKATATPVVYHRASRTVDNITYVAVGQVLGSQTRRTNRVFNSYSTKTI